LAETDVLAVTTADDGADAGTQFDGIMTAVVPGIVYTLLAGIDEGTADEAMTTGLFGKADTTIYELVGRLLGIDLGVTNGAVKTN